MENNMNEKDTVNHVSSNGVETEINNNTNKQEVTMVEKNVKDKKNRKKPLIFNFSNKKKNKKNEVPSVVEKKEEETKAIDPVELPSMIKQNEQETIQNLSPEMPIEQENKVPVTPSFEESKESEADFSALPIESNGDFKKENLETVPNIETQANNFIPPADFNNIFNVESEEKETLPSSVKMEDDVHREVQNTLKSEETIALGNSNNESESKDKKEGKKGEVFNSKERVLYEIKAEKEGNPIVVVLFFAFLFSVIVILPYISKKYDLWTEKANTPPVITPSEEESEFYYFNRSSVRAKIGGLEFTNFVKSKQNREYFLTFNITNTNSNAYQFDKKYYIVFYDGESIAYRALIYAYEAIGSNAATEVTLTINERGYSNADKFKIVEIPVAAYPEVETTEKDGDYSVLKCNYLNDEIKYYFLDKKLVKLTETYTENFDSAMNYESQKVAYRNLSSSYKNVKNFNSTFIETNTYFTMINEFNHKDISDSTLYNLKTYKFFKYNETINTVSYELEAQGYTCS